MLTSRTVETRMGQLKGNEAKMPQNDIVEGQTSRILNNVVNLVTHVRNSATVDSEVVYNLIEGSYDALDKISDEVTNLIPIEERKIEEKVEAIKQEYQSAASVRIDAIIGTLILVGGVLTLLYYII